MTPELADTLQRLDLIYLKHRGRKSGEEYEAELSFASDDAAVYLLAHLEDGLLPDWLANIVATGEALFHAGVRLLKGTPELLDAEWIQRVEAMFRAKYGAEVVRKWYEGAPQVAVRLHDIELA
ncbi:MAG: nitroreductase/quinone reductase family protein [Dehalococcoidia bacterium]